MSHKAAIFLLALVAAGAVWALVPLEGLARPVLAITVFVVLLWVTEELPLHVTALLAALLLVVTGLPGPQVFANFFDPVIVLFLGGFVIAIALAKHGLDAVFAHAILRRAGQKPARVLLGLMGATAFLSMWISNTATAAVMMPIALVLLTRNRLRPGSSFGKAAVLGVAYAATIGGVGTVIGSTPNILAAKYLGIGFMDWFVRGFPFMLLLLFAGWAVLMKLYPPEKKELAIKMSAKNMSRSQVGVLAVFLVTVFLWVTEALHGLSSALVAVIPIVLLYATGLLGRGDFAKVDWETLILIGGGLALGSAIHQSSLDALLIGPLGSFSGSPLELFLLLGAVGVLLTVFISNTTASAVYIPLAVALASALGANTASVVVIAALGVSLDFLFPFGTPPTAIAYHTRYVREKDILRAGLVISVIGVLALALLGVLWT